MTLTFSSPTILFWGIFVTILIIVGWIYRLTISNQHVKVLFWLRFIVLFLLLFLLLDPNIKHSFIDEKPLEWNIYIDNSVSMDYHGNPTISSLETSLEKIKHQIDEINPNVNYYYFSNTIDPKKMSNRHSTDLGLVINHIQESEPIGLSGALIISDGQTNQGLDPQQKLDDINVPIFCLGVGEKTPMIDLAIETFDFPPIAIVNEEVEMKIGIGAYGKFNKRLDVTLYQGNKLVGSKVMQLEGDGAQHQVTFRVKPTQLGNLTYQAKVSVLEDEVNIINNKQSMNLKVLKAKYSIGLLTGAPNYNTGLIKQILKSNSRYELDHYIYVQENFTPTLKQFWKTPYDLIVLDNHPVSENAMEWEQLSKILAKKVIAQKSALMFLAGPETSAETIKHILPLFSSKRLTQFLEKGRENKWTFSDTLHSIFPFESNLLSELQSYEWPPLTSGLELNGEDQMVLAQFQISDLDIPVLLVGEKNEFRYGLWSTPDLYSLHYKLIGTKQSGLISSLWNGLFSWLLKTGGDQQYFFRYNKKSYQQGEQIIVTGIGGAEGHDNPNGLIRLYQDGEWINDQPLKYDIRQNKYFAEYWSSTPGIFKYDIFLENNDNNQLVGQGTYMVQESKVELNRVYLNESLLSTISHKTGGEYYSLDQRDQIKNQFIPKVNQIKKTNNYILNENILMLGLIIILLSIEWIIRRKLGFL